MSLITRGLGDRRRGMLLARGMLGSTLASALTRVAKLIEGVVSFARTLTWEVR